MIVGFVVVGNDLVVVIPLECAEAVGLAVDATTVVDTDYVVERHHEVGIVEIDVERAGVVSGVVGNIEEFDCGLIVSGRAVVGNSEGDEAVVGVTIKPVCVKACGKGFVGEEDAIMNRFALLHVVA